MGHEVDILGVGEKSNSGDAIALRFGNLHGDRSEQVVVIIDGGYKDDGQKLVEHITEHFDTNKVDVVISTHPDQDHINGLQTVIEELEVSELWIHKAWDHNEGLAAEFKDGRITDNSISERLKESLNQAHELVKKAEEKGIIIREPFTGLTRYGIRILGPSLEFYEKLLPQFDGMPEAKKIDETAKKSLAAALLDSAKAMVHMVFPKWGTDEIDDEDGTSAKNNSSVITQIVDDGHRLIFTGDAGITALNYAANELEGDQDDATLTFFQIPHHGSRRNIGPEVLNRLIGKPLESEGGSRHFSAIASTAKEGEPKHPHKSVLNAFIHRGATVHATRGLGIRHNRNAPERRGWGALNGEPFSTEPYEEEA
ncbi:ComEC/Rec2 family competence protein [Endozoicomonas sp. ALB032]|uniref:ComEC/Rec2 family competence protein n=1 Tax=Endozoicomonas sp. ALB032 TaxID=3403082 RepID=UPI003BB64DF1